MNLYRKLRNIAWRASMKGLPRGPHLSRYSMYNRLAEVGKTLPKNGRVLSISRSATQLAKRLPRLRHSACFFSA